MVARPQIALAMLAAIRENQMNEMKNEGGILERLAARGRE